VYQASAQIQGANLPGVTNLAIDGVDTLKLYHYLYDKRGISA
jgi:hypothetical protein